MMSRIDGKIRLVLFGLGNRGQKYLGWIRLNPEAVSLVAVVEPDRDRWNVLGKDFCGSIFSSPEEFFSGGAEADAVIISSPDRTHFPIAMEAVSRRMHVLVEKPMATDADECRALVRAAEENAVNVSVCFVLRHHPFYRKLKQILELPGMGRVLSVNHIVNVGIDRAVHTFVRGLWSREEDTCPVILSKCSHDVDLLIWLCSEDVKRVSSFGSTGLFVPQNAPERSTGRCITCPVERECAFSAVDLYVRRDDWNSFFPRREGESRADAVRRELESGAHGRCVFRCDNDVPDHQVLSMEMESGAVVSVLMNFLTLEDNRVTYFSCTGGEIWADGKTIRHRLFSDGKMVVTDMEKASGGPLHAGADYAILEDFISAIRDSSPLAGTSAREALGSHLACLEADDSNKK